MCWTCVFFFFFFLAWPQNPGYTSKTKLFPCFILFFKPRFWPLHAMQLARWDGGSLRSQAHVSISYSFTLFLHLQLTFSYKIQLLSQNIEDCFSSAAGSWKTNEICTDVWWTADIPQVQTSDWDTVGLPKPEWQKYRNQHTFLFNGLCMQQASETKAEQTTMSASTRRAANCQPNSETHWHRMKRIFNPYRFSKNHRVF